MIRNSSIILMILILGLGCKRDHPKVEKPTHPSQEVTEIKETTQDSVVDIPLQEPKETSDVVASNDPVKTNPAPVNASFWSELTAEDGFILDIKYATTDNFTKKKIYDCGKCYMRPDAAAKLKVIQQEFKEKYGYGIKLFDCFRPRPYQQRLWDIVPDPDYVTPPHKGSMHSRGLAVDLTLVDKNGKELDMGTAFDFFGPEAHQGYNHNDQVKRHRWILKSTMEKHGFGSIRTEWWHYSYKGKSWPLDEWVWECE
jgi:zinc D-Ala-D-Ala dipeptidase